MGDAVQCLPRSLSFTGHAPSFCLVAFSESPSEATWLENAPGGEAKRADARAGV